MTSERGNSLSHPSLHLIPMYKPNHIRRIGDERMKRTNKVAANSSYLIFVSLSIIFKFIRLFCYLLFAYLQRIPYSLYFFLWMSYYQLLRNTKTTVHQWTNIYCIPIQKRNYAAVIKTRINYYGYKVLKILYERRGRKNFKITQQSDDNLIANHSLELLKFIHSYR